MFQKDRIAVWLEFNKSGKHISVRDEISGMELDTKIIEVKDYETEKTLVNERTGIAV